MKNALKIKTKRLIISPKTAEELRETMDQEQDLEMKQAYKEMLEGCLSHQDKWMWYTDWTISLKDGTSIGGVGFKGEPDEKAQVEIGYGIDEPYQRQGYAYEAISMMLDWAFSNENLYYIMAETVQDNVASQGLLKKLGFRETGVIGEEGPRFEKEKEKSSYMSTFMSMGMCFGVCFGMSIFHNLALGLCFGMGIGMVIGSRKDEEDKKKREELKKLRETEKREA